MSVTLADLNTQFRLLNSGWSNAVNTIAAPRHRWYFFKEGFSPDIVRSAIEDAKCKPGDTVIDPFCGSGTVPLIAALDGYRAIGYEVNPFLEFLAKTKLLQAKVEDLDRARILILSEARKGKESPLETFSTFSPAGGSEKWLFNTDVIRAFQGGWDATGQLEGSVQGLMRLALIAAAMDSCNATKDGKCLRYKKGWRSLHLSSAHFLIYLESRIASIRADLASSPIHENTTDIRLADCRQALSLDTNSKFQLCITSPPYLNSFDYTDVYRPELFLGNFISSQDELMDLRLRTVRSHVQAKWQRPLVQGFGPLYEDSLGRIQAKADKLWDARILLMIQAYFEDLHNILSNLRRLAAPGARLWLVVSTSAYVGVEVPVDLILAEIGQRVGWSVQEIGLLRYLRSSGQHWNQWAGPEDEKPRLRESVIVLGACGEH